MFKIHLKCGCVMDSESSLLSRRCERLKRCRRLLRKHPVFYTVRREQHIACGLGIADA